MTRDFLIQILFVCSFNFKSISARLIEATMELTDEQYREYAEKYKIGEEAWLASSERWNDDWLRTTTTPNTRWVGKKILGRGNFAVAGLWELTDQTTGEVTRRMVVKQGSLAEPSLENETESLKAGFLDPNYHILRMLRERYVDKGQGSFAGFAQFEEVDPPPKGNENTVERAYFEFVENGNMATWLRKTIYKDFSSVTPMPEWHFWKIWECLTRGICVLAHGNDSLEPLGSDFERGFVHFDLKADNGKCLTTWIPMKVCQMLYEGSESY